MKFTAVFGLLLLVFCGVCAASDIASVSVTETSLSTTEDTLAVDYTVVEFEMPDLSNGTQLLEAVLTLYMDVSSVLPDELSGGLATVEVAVMPALVMGKLDVSAVGTMAKRSVRVGQDRTVRLYVTDILLEAMHEIGSEAVLIVGPISGSRNGRFDAKQVPGAALGAKAVLTFHTQAPFVDGALNVAE